MRRQKSQAEAWCIYVSSCDHGCCDLQTPCQVVKEVSTETIRTCVGRLSEASLEYPSQATWCICASGPSQERQRACCRAHEVPKGSQHGWSLGGMLVAISGLSSCSANRPAPRGLAAAQRASAGVQGEWPLSWHCCAVGNVDRPDFWASLR